MNLIEDTGTTDLGKLIQEMDKPKQSFPTPGYIENKQENINIDSDTAINNTDKDVVTVSNSEKDFNKISKKYFRISDMILIQIASWISGESKKRISLDKEDAEYFVEVIKDVAEEQDWKDPGSLSVLIVMFVVAYGGVFSDAFKIRKIKKESKKLTQENKDISKKLIRICPDCGTELEYKTKNTFIDAVLNESRCDSCKNKI
jgi:hypothetical protein